MTIELLFAKACQGRTFLLMVLCGSVCALGVQLAGSLHRRSRLPGMAADALCVIALTLALCRILLQSGEGLRLYGLLGLCIGGALYAAGLAPAVNWLTRRLPRRPAAKISPARQQECSPSVQKSYDYQSIRKG